MRFLFVLLLSLSLFVTTSAEASCFFWQTDKKDQQTAVLQVDKATYDRLVQEGKAHEIDRHYMDQNDADAIVDMVHSSEKTASSLPSGDGGKEAALIIFVIIGVVILVAWVPQMFMVLEETFTSTPKHECFAKFGLSATSGTAVSNRSDLAEFETKREFSLVGANYGYHIVKDRSKYFHFGLDFEAGSLEIDGQYSDNSSRNVKTGYFLIGPSIYMGSFEDREIMHVFGTLDFLVGTGFKSEIGLLSQAKLAMNIGIAKSYFFGVGLAANYVGAKLKEGYLTDRNELSVSLGFQLGILY